MDRNDLDMTAHKISRGIVINEGETTPFKRGKKAPPKVLKGKG